ncbi:MAG TPA: VCBS repeat-containing protein, partial [bacterium]|nr:VCBS repeat-containing protein [bacterium]
GNYNFELVNAEMGIEVIDRFSYIIPFDYNNDGLTDFLAQTNYIMDKNHFILFENNNGKFYKKNILQNVFLDILNWTSADFNFDGRKDLFLSFANAKIGDKILNNILLLNFKDKGFVFSYKNSPFLNTDNPITISEYIDYNADKKKDLITYSIDNIFKIWRNNEKFNFDETAEFTVSGLKYLTQIITADIDNDGDDDIILVLNDNIKIYKNRSNTYIK